MRTWSGYVHVAFIIDAFARMIVGWQASCSLRTDLCLDALEQAIWARREHGLDELVHHSDRCVQLRFNESSQHCLVRPILRVGRAPRQESSSQGSYGVAC